MWQVKDMLWNVCCKTSLLSSLPPALLVFYFIYLLSLCEVLFGLSIHKLFYCCLWRISRVLNWIKLQLSLGILLSFPAWLKLSSMIKMALLTYFDNMVTTCTGELINPPSWKFLSIPKILLKCKFLVFSCTICTEIDVLFVLAKVIMMVPLHSTSKLSAN